MGQFATGKGPWLVWIATVGLAVWVFQDMESGGRVIGFAHGVDYEVAPLRSARVQSIAVDVGQAVRAGQVIATLDTTEVDHELAILEARKTRSEAAVDAAEEDAHRRAVDEAHDLASQLARAETRLAGLEADRVEASVELKVQRAERDRIAKLVDARLVDQGRLATLDARVATLRARVSGARGSLHIAERRVDEVRTRQAMTPQERVAKAVAPLRGEVDVMEARIRALRDQRAKLVLRSPSDGHVSDVHLHTGGVAGPDTPVATVVGSGGGRVVACLAEHQALEVQVGDPATLWPRQGAADPVRGHVVGLGAIMDTVPSRCRPNMRGRVWGRDVMILLDEPLALLPGQVLDVRLEPRTSLPPSSAHAATQAQAKGGIREMSVPAALRQRSRFEPSGLVWVPRLMRYVVVSDDTGHPDLDDHAPWLFTVDAQGQVDPAPLPIRSAESIHDMEAIASGPGGTLYVLCSQSVNRHGRRPASRELFLRLAPEPDGYRLDGSVRLAQRLEALSETQRAKLGLTDIAQLDMEALTSRDDGLLLGVKSPLDAQGRALIWKLAEPAELFRGGGLEKAGLTLWSRVALTVQADGASTPGGIAELLSLPDGGLLIASTASRGRPSRQDGALWWAADPDPADLQVQRIEVFEGLKPEALALAPSPGKVMVAFDRGAEVPMWTELSRPVR